MTLDEMQKRLQALFVDKANIEQQLEQFKNNSIMIQGHINELSFLIQQSATPAAQPVPEPEGEQSAVEEGIESESDSCEHQD